MRTWMIIATVAAMLSGCAAGHRRQAVPDVAPRAGKTRTGTAGLATVKPLVIDVRSQQEWSGGHIEGAILIPHTEIAERITEAAPDKAQSIYLYCRSGRRSGIAKRVLEQMGYTNVENLGSIKDARKRLESR